MSLIPISTEGAFAVTMLLVIISGAPFYCRRKRPGTTRRCKKPIRIPRAPDQQCVRDYYREFVGRKS